MTIVRVCVKVKKAVRCLGVKTAGVKLKKHIASYLPWQIMMATSVSVGTRGLKRWYYRTETNAKIGEGGKMKTALYRQLWWCDVCNKETQHLWEEERVEEGKCEVVRLCVQCSTTRIVPRPDYSAGTDTQG